MALALAPLTATPLTLCRDYGCSTVQPPGIVIEPDNHVTANGVRTPARTVRYDLSTGKVTAYEVVIFRASFENEE